MFVIRRLLLVWASVAGVALVVLLVHDHHQWKGARNHYARVHESDLKYLNRLWGIVRADTTSDRVRQKAERRIERVRFGRRVKNPGNRFWRSDYTHKTVYGGLGLAGVFLLITGIAIPRKDGRSSFDACVGMQPQQRPSEKAHPPHQRFSDDE